MQDGDSMTRYILAYIHHNYAKLNWINIKSNFNDKVNNNIKLMYSKNDEYLQTFWTVCRLDPSYLS